MYKYLAVSIFSISALGCGNSSSSTDEPASDNPNAGCSGLQLGFQNLDAEGFDTSDEQATFAELDIWTITSGNTSSTAYGQGGYPEAEADQGQRLFTGGNDEISIAEQNIALPPDLAGCEITISADIGGFGSQEDNAVVELTFMDSTGAVLSTSTLGPVTASERQNSSVLLNNSLTGTIPAEAVQTQLRITQTRLEGTANDGYVDNIIITPN